MKKAILALMLLAPAATLAADGGPYVALDVQSWNLTNLPAGASGPSTGYRIGGGYRFTPNWAVEADYAHASGSSGGGGYGMASGPAFDSTSIQAAVIGAYPVHDMIDVFAKLGIASNKLSGSAVSTLEASGFSGFSATSLLWGFGVQYNPVKEIGIRLQYENLGKTTRINAGLSDLSAATISLGVAYYF